MEETITDIKMEFVNWIQDSQFPCIGAKVAANKNLLSLIICPDIDSGQSDRYILRHIYQFIGLWKNDRELLQSFVVIFKNPVDLSEIMFERMLWRRLQALHNLDREWHSWDHRVSSEVTNPDFSFSLGNTGFFVIGLHQNSARKARQFTYPTLVFNLHEQFQILRNCGSFQNMRDKIRCRDVQLSGSINPMVSDFGESSEALQYSGRNTSKHYRCPFIYMNKK